MIVPVGDSSLMSGQVAGSDTFYAWCRAQEQLKKNGLIREFQFSNIPLLILFQKNKGGVNADDADKMAGFQDLGYIGHGFTKNSRQDEDDSI
ncbi:hypothetical protein Peur_026242 [Populus x canadensis]